MRLFMRLSFVVLLCLVLSTASNSVFAQIAVGKVHTLASVVPDISWTDGGKTVKLSDVAKDKVVFINFWGTWCPPCRKEIPDIIEISKEEKDVIVIGIALERVKDRVKQVQDYAQKTGIPYMNVTGDDKVIGNVVNAFGGINAVPTTFIVNKAGMITEQIVGSQSKSEFLASIKKAR
jgi:thiol-disulfide isomerase/thioredoxin